MDNQCSQCWNASWTFWIIKKLGWWVENQRNRADVSIQTFTKFMFLDVFALFAPSIKKYTKSDATVQVL